MTARAVFLDRDGVINRAVVRNGKPYPPRSSAELEILPGVSDALNDLRLAGFLRIVITNQPDVARGTQLREVVEGIHALLLATLAIDEVIACYHDGDDCNCRKPKAGAILDAGLRHDVDLENSFMIGDRWKDIEAGQRAGCKCIFVDYSYAERRPDAPYVTVTSLGAAAKYILGQPSTDT